MHFDKNNENVLPFIQTQTTVVRKYLSEIHLASFENISQRSEEQLTGLALELEVYCQHETNKSCKIQYDHQ